MSEYPTLSEQLKEDIAKVAACLSGLPVPDWKLPEPIKLNTRYRFDNGGAVPVDNPLLSMSQSASVGERWRTPFPTINELQNDNSRDILPSVQIKKEKPVEDSKYTPNFVHCEYLEKFIQTDRLKESLELACQALMGWEFTTLAFRGVSGTLIGPALALRLNKTMICVRKPNDGSHSKWKDAEDNLAEGDAGARRYIIVDDFISSGSTARAIFAQVKKFAPHADCLGVLEVYKVTDNRLFQHRGSRYPLNNEWR